MKLLNSHKLLLAGAVFLSLILAVQFVSADKLKLKTGAKGQLCLNCHEGFKEKLSQKSVHTPVKTGECSGCHNPHTSSHGQLLNSASKDLCFSCHDRIIPDNARSEHKIECSACHDAHAAPNRYVLLKRGNAICTECHKEAADADASARFRHAPVDEIKGCMNCHDPHASDANDNLLKKAVPALCVACHETEKPSFLERHMNYPVEESICSDCHDSHGSSRAFILLQNMHEPVAKKQCRKCHPDPESDFALSTSRNGAALCRKCHQESTDNIFSKKRIHWPVLDRDGCLNCHSPHASSGKNLLKGSISSICGTCHADTIRLQEASRNNPENAALCKPVKEGECSACHSPHAADNLLLSDQESFSTGVCGRCHEWKAHSAHPLGKDIIDPRNKNLVTDCLSCHRACGTGNYPRMTHFSTITETCVQCHEELDKR
ncbi:MAG: cytochrome C [Nitrospira sp.]|nr:cytochrome C [bacterium]MBL7049939.1 cytochrome C [Nitrospira sp.]